MGWANVDTKVVSEALQALLILRGLGQFRGPLDERVGWSFQDRQVEEVLLGRLTVHYRVPRLFGD